MCQSLLASDFPSQEGQVGLEKAGKCIGTLTRELALAHKQIARQDYLLSTTSSVKERKRIPVDQYQRFADIDNIKRAVDQAVAVEAQKATRTKKKYQKKAPDLAPATVDPESMCTQWQL